MSNSQPIYCVYFVYREIHNIYSLYRHTRENAEPTRPLRRGREMHILLSKSHLQVRHYTTSGQRVRKIHIVN